MPEISYRDPTLLRVKLFLAIFCYCFGITGFVIAIMQGNWTFCIWCVVLALVCTAVIWSGEKYQEDKLVSKYSPAIFKFLEWISAFLGIGSWIASNIYIYVGANNNEVFGYFSSYSKGLLAVVVGFWSLVMYFDAKKYGRLTGLPT